MREKYACFILSHCGKEHLGVDWTALGCTRLSDSQRDCYNWGNLGKLRACLPFEINPAVIAGGVRTYYGTCCDCLHDKCCAARITGRCCFTNESSYLVKCSFDVFGTCCNYSNVSFSGNVGEDLDLRTH